LNANLKLVLDIVNLKLDLNYCYAYNKYMEIIYCPDCKNEMVNAADECPQCGHQDELDESVGSFAMISMILFIIIMIIFAVIST
jgi:hypothetical protein